MWHNNTHVSSVCTVSIHLFLFTISNVFKIVCQTYVILCTLWMHYLSWNSSVLKRWHIISESNEPQRVPVEFPLFSPGTTTKWDCVRNSHWEEVQSVGQDHILWQWDPSLLLSLDMQEGRCGTTGSCWRAYLQFYLTLPCVWSERLLSLEDLEPLIYSFERLFQRNLYEDNLMVRYYLTSLSTGWCSALKGFPNT